MRPSLRLTIGVLSIGIGRAGAHADDQVSQEHLKKWRTRAARHTPVGGGADSRSLRLLNLFATPERDIYQFGVFTGSGLHKLSRVRNAGHIWGFDSFRGIPSESAAETDAWRDPAGNEKINFLEGGYSVAAKLQLTSINSAMRAVARRVGQPERVTLIPGYFNETCTDALLGKHKMQPALLVDQDSDIYKSAIDSMDWLFRNKLIVPGTFVRYDDFPRRNATFGPAKGTNFFGQARAHYELSEKYDVRWKLVSKGMVQAVSIGTERCAPALCDKAPALRDQLLKANPQRTIRATRDEAMLLPFWGPMFTREGLC